MNRNKIDGGFPTSMKSQCRNAMLCSQQDKLETGPNSFVKGTRQNAGAFRQKAYISFNLAVLSSSRCFSINSVIAAVYNRLRFIPRFLAVSSACVKIFSGIEMAVFNDFIKSSLYFWDRRGFLTPQAIGLRNIRS